MQKVSSGGVSPSEWNSSETNTPFLGYYWHLSEVFDVRLSQSLSSILSDFLPGRTGRGSWGGRKEAEGGRKPPSCHNTELRILLRFDANASGSPWFILKFGGGGGRRAWGALSLWATAWLWEAVWWGPLSGHLYFPPLQRTTVTLGESAVTADWLEVCVGQTQGLISSRRLSEWNLSCKKIIWPLQWVCDLLIKPLW